MDRYILDGHDAVEEPDLIKWAKWMETADRQVDLSTAVVKLDGQNMGEVRISTVFLGLNHNFGEGKPLVFETMIFGGPLDGNCQRSATWDEAEITHKLACELVKNAIL